MVNMVWKRRIDPKKATLPAILATLIIAVVVFFLMGNGSATFAHAELFAAICIALASFAFALGYVMWQGLGNLQDVMARWLIALNIILPIILVIVVGVVSTSLSRLPRFDWLTLALYSIGLSLLGALLSIVLFVSLKEALGESSIEKIHLNYDKLWKIWGQYRQSKAGMFALTVLVIMIVIAIIGPAIAMENPTAVKYGQGGSSGGLPTPPDSTYWLGTDHQHKDILSQILYGAGTSLLVGFLAGAISLLLGTGIGLSAGYYGRAVDELLMRLTDVFLVIPWFPLMIVLVAILGKSLWIVIFVIGITSWSPTARVVRAAVLSIKEKQYIERSRALGGRNMHIITKHILPNVFPLIVATSILLVAEAIFSEAFLDFFGLGDPSVVSWGWMLERAHANGAMLNFWWWWILPPGLCIILLVMSFYLVGDTLDEILNPRLKRR